MTATLLNIIPIIQLETNDFVREREKDSPVDVHGDGLPVVHDVDAQGVGGRHREVQERLRHREVHSLQVC